MPVGTASYRTRPGSVLVVHGPGLLRKDLREFWTASFWIDADYALVSRAVRSEYSAGSKEMETWKRFGKRYLNWYVQAMKPSEQVNKVLDGLTVLTGGGEIRHGTG
jgi:hypothetical protein